MKISDLKPESLNARVIYTPSHTDWAFFNTRTNLHKGRENGVITSWNDEYVFVRYGDDEHSKATRPEDLEFEPELAREKCGHE